MRLLILLLVAGAAAAQEYARLAWKRDGFDHGPPQTVALRKEKIGKLQGEFYGYVALGDGPPWALAVARNHVRLEGRLLQPLREQRVDLVLPIPFRVAAKPPELPVRFDYRDGVLHARTGAVRVGDVVVGGRSRAIVLVDGNCDFRFDHATQDYFRLDADGNGALDKQERFRVGDEFRVGDRRYALTLVEPSGGEVFASERAVEPGPPAGRRAWALAAAADPKTSPATAATAGVVLAAQADAEAIEAALQLAERGPDHALPRLGVLLGRVREPAAVAVILRRLGTKQRHLRAIAAEAAGGIPGEKVTRELARRIEREQDDAVLSVLAEAVRDRPDPRRLKALAAQCAEGPVADRVSAAKTLVALGPEHAEVAAALTRLLKARDAETVIAVLSAAGDLKERELIATTALSLKNPSWRVRLFAAEALGRMRLNESIPPLVGRLGSEQHQRVRAAIGASLYALTHENLLDHFDLWERWWAERGARFVVPGLPPQPRPKKANERRTVAKFYGVPIESKRIIFVIDQSASMSKPDAGGTRWRRALAEVDGAVGQLPRGASINVVLFQTDIWTWKPKLTPVSKRVRKELNRELGALSPRGGTWLFDGLVEALNDPDVEEIYLLSDGNPSGGRFVSAADIVREISRLNTYRRVIIHCIAVGMDSTLLQQLAKANDGTYVRR